MNSERYARPDVLVDTEWLENHLPDPAVRIVEVDVSPAAYREGHIPGAVLWNVYKDLKDANYRLVDKAAIESLVQRSGITRESVVVFYGYAPAMGFWLMKLFGHPDARILNAARATWTADVHEPAESHYPRPAQDERIRAQQPVVEQAIGATGCTILDVRTDAEYSGERFWPSGGMEEGGRAGHVLRCPHSGRWLTR